MADLPDPLRLVRPQDLLTLELRVSNLRVAADGLRLERIDPARPALLIFRFPPQHVAEEAFFRFESGAQAAPAPPVGSIAADPSRLVFALPDNVADLPLTDILAWEQLVPHLAPNALPMGSPERPRPGIPSADVTAIEFPWRMLLSPDATAHWVHRRQPFTANGRSEVWHTRLTGSGRTVPVRAIGYRPVADSIRTSLELRDIEDVVRLSGDFGIRPKSWVELGLPMSVWMARMRQSGMDRFRYDPTPLDAEQLMLTPLGASVRLQGQWEFPPPPYQPAILAQFGIESPSLEKYLHTAGTGRDQLVRVVRRGWVSTTHRASILKTTERQFEPILIRTEAGPDGPVGIFGSRAYLRQWITIEIQQHVQDFVPLAGGYTHGGREMPLRSVRLTTLTTPPIDLPIDLAESEAHHRGFWALTHEGGEAVNEDWLGRQIQSDLEQAFQQPFWIRVNGADFEFCALGTDWEEKPVTYRTPLMFIPQESVGNYNAVKTEYASGPAQRRQRPIGNQVVALAGPTEPALARGSTSSATESLTFALPQVAGPVPASYQPSWLYSVTAADAHLEAVERVTGKRDAVAITFDPLYLANGLVSPANPAALYATLPPVTVAMPAERGGGLARPQLSVAKLSSRQGSLPDQFAKPGPPDVVSAFAGAKILGTIALTDIVTPPSGLDPANFELADLAEAEFQARVDSATELIDVPVLRTRQLLDAGKPYAVEARFVWKPKPRNIPDLLTFDRAVGIVLETRIVTPLDGKPAKSDVRGQLRDFSLHLVGVVKVHMARLEFTSLEGRKPDISAEGFNLEFEGPLEFVNTLQKILPADGFSDPPAVAVTAEGIQAGYTLGIPSVGIGIFSLQNLSLSAAVSIPFIGKPAGLRFAISERHHPFLVTVTLFGGGLLCPRRQREGPRGDGGGHRVRR